MANTYENGLNSVKHRFGNLDISTYSNSNVNDKSEASVGDSYIHPEYEKGSDILAGSIRFSTIEIEVFTTETKK